MRARLSPVASLNAKQREALQEFILKQGEEIFESQSITLINRMMKLFSVALNEQYGFGKQRLSNLIDHVSKLSSERKDDPIFWRHVDFVVIKQIGLDFKPESED